MRRLALVPLVLFLLAAPLAAGDGEGPAKEKPAAAKPLPGEGMTAIVGGDVLTVTRGTYGRGTVLVGRDGKIAAAGVKVSVPEGATVIDAAGKKVTPGLFGPLSSRIGVSSRVGGGNRFADSLDPYDLSLELALSAGVTAVAARARRTGMDTAVYKLARGDLEGMMLREPAFMTLSYGSPSERFSVRDSFRKAREYVAAYETYEREKAAGKKVSPPGRPVSEEYVRAVRGEIPVVIGAVSADDILAALALVDEFGVRLLLERAAECWIVAEEIAKRRAGVLLSPRYLPYPDRMRDGPSGGSIECARILEEKGVRFGVVPVNGSRITSLGGIAGHDLLFLTMEAAYAIRGGASEREVLRALTIVPAEMFGVADRIGSVEVGKDADLVVWSGDPFAVRSWPEIVLVNGRIAYDREKSGLYPPPVEKEE